MFCILLCFSLLLFLLLVLTLSQHTVPERNTITAWFLKVVALHSLIAVITAVMRSFRQQSE